MSDLKIGAVVTDAATNGSKFYYGTTQEWRGLSDEVAAVIQSELNYLTAVCQRLSARGKGDLQAVLTFEKDGAPVFPAYTVPNISNEDVRRVEQEFSLSLKAVFDFMADRRRGGKH